MEQRTLGNTGIQLSVLGFGAATLGDIYGGIDPDEGTRAVRHAIDRGINFIDVAPYYGLTLAETRLGEALDGVRDQVVLSSKCCRYGMREFDFSGKSVTESLDASLKRLRTDHLDLFIIHDVEFGDREQVEQEAVPAALEAKALGKVRAVGISGLPVHHLANVAAATGVDFVLSYCHYNLLVDDLDTVLVPHAATSGMGLINASPLHMGVLSSEGPPEWHPGGDDIKETGRKVIELCDTRGANASQVSLRFALDHPTLTSTLCGMKTRAQVDQNLAILDMQNDPTLLAEIADLVAPVKNRTWPEGLPENNP